MNSWQMAQQIKHKLANVTWAAGSAQYVFGPRSVFVFSGQPPSDKELSPGFPFALVTIDAGTADDDHPELINQTFAVTIACEAAGDPMGENAVIGSARVDLGKSAGAGSAEVGERVRYALQSLSGVDGAPLIVSGAGITGPSVPAEGRHITFETYTVNAYCTSQPYYTSPEQLRYVSGAWRWAGLQCTSRFDFKSFRLGYSAGSKPAEDPAETTIVYTGSATSFVTTKVAGRAYTIWADYDPRKTGTAAATSSLVVGSWVVT